MMGLLVKGNNVYTFYGIAAIYLIKKTIKVTKTNKFTKKEIKLTQLQFSSH